MLFLSLALVAVILVLGRDGERLHAGVQIQDEFKLQLAGVTDLGDCVDNIENIE